ncbi:hypothetical protein [Lapidilactobacillus luobeiensis]|uniref:hypothetical protein n=1 Tax=Lapidilactobacillus luobeiensis TaxID=2950371 RepID=UPI0021C38969|nr:hypothetical protein [Lapidilactobacillus luobeiensis]
MNPKKNHERQSYDKKWGDYSEYQILSLVNEEIKRIGIQDHARAKEYNRKRDKENAPSTNWLLTYKKLTWAEIVFKLGYKSYSNELKWDNMTDEELIVAAVKFMHKKKIFKSGDYNRLVHSEETPTLLKIMDRMGTFTFVQLAYIKKYGAPKDATKLNWNVFSNDQLLDLFRAEIKRIHATGQGDYIKRYDNMRAPGFVRLKDNIGQGKTKTLRSVYENKYNEPMFEPRPKLT